MRSPVVVFQIITLWNVEIIFVGIIYSISRVVIGAGRQIAIWQLHQRVEGLTMAAQPLGGGEVC